jgi:hypothetical protein
VVDDTGQVVLDRRVDNDPAAIQALIEELGGLGQGQVVGMDVVGGIATWSKPCSPWPASGWSMCPGWR